MFIEITLLMLGILGLWFSAGLIVGSAKIISEKLNISDTFLGLTLLSVGTSLAEIGTHVVTSVKMLQEGTDISGVAVGTNIGSNIIQITLILGITGFFMTIRAKGSFLKKDYVVMLMAIFMVWVFSLDARLARWEGAVLVISYLFYLWTLGDKEKLMEKIEDKKKKGLLIHVILILLGTGFLILSSKVSVESIVGLSDILGVTNTLLGTLVLGAGTALPELATAVAALRKKLSGMSLGVLVGSNITNPLFALGLGTAISGYSVEHSVFWYDLPFWFCISLVVLHFLRRGHTLEKHESVMLVCFYIVYAVARIILFG